MDKRKKIINEYKECLLHGGVYTITNTQSGKYLIGHTANLKSVQNRFQFAITTGSTLHPKLKKDGVELGTQAFTLEILSDGMPRNTNFSLPELVPYIQLYIYPICFS
jgi:hypothetical protein